MNTSPSGQLNRIESIDIFRAITMLLMIFVNDLWTVKAVPKWMEHSETFQDYMGLADIVFPCFLFIVGMSIPLAIENRIAKAASKLNIIYHISTRTLALLIMGIFTVNLGSLDSNRTGLGEPVFEILMVLGFFLSWNQYQKRESWQKQLFSGLQILGIALLLFLAIIYRSKAGTDGQIHWLRVKWWGILGLIGWAYGLTAIIYLFSRKHKVAIVIAWAFFTLFNILGHSGLFGMHMDQSPIELFPGNGAFQSFALAGLIATLIISGKFNLMQDRFKSAILALMLPGMLLIFAGLLLNHWFIISKNLATPPWILITTGIAFIQLSILHWIVDSKGKASWFNIIKAAGVFTLTCYLLPYIVYSIFDIFNIQAPGQISTGLIGLGKSLVFSLIIVGITAFLGRMKINLKI